MLRGGRLVAVVAAEAGDAYQRLHAAGLVGGACGHRALACLPPARHCRQCVCEPQQFCCERKKAQAKEKKCELLSMRSPAFFDSTEIVIFGSIEPAHGDSLALHSTTFALGNGRPTAGRW
eukprot:m.351841 g.351841  ORF g.351841 m.351841 type:complete len:120 (+) comp19898_c13_seq1:4220-4579(+)